MLAWILNLDGAGSSSTTAPAPLNVRKAHEWVAAYVYAPGQATPAARRTYASYGASAVVPGTVVVDVVVCAEGTPPTPMRLPVNLVRYSPGQSVAGHHRLVTESTGETVV